MTWKVPLTTLTIGPEEEAAAVRALRSRWITMGPEVEAFEREFAEALGVRYALAAANATGALAMAYDAVGTGPDDEVVMPALTFVASMNVAMRRGEKPVLVDIVGEDDLTMDPADLEQKITPRTGLIVTMPYGGFAPDMDAILRIARTRRIPVVEDACHGILARWNGRMIGSFGAAAVFSFYGNKNMTTGEGGMIVTGDRPVYERLRLMRSHGISRSSRDHFMGELDEYDVMVAGHNFRMDDIRAAIGREQLRKLPAANARRRENAVRIRALCAEKCPDLRLPFSSRDPQDASHHLLPAILPEGVDRPRFMRSMADHGVQTSVHYRPLHRFTHTTGLWSKPPRLPRLESIERRLVTLPLGPSMTEEQMELVATAAARSLA